MVAMIFYTSPIHYIGVWGQIQRGSPVILRVSQVLTNYVAYAVLILQVFIDGRISYGKTEKRIVW